MKNLFLLLGIMLITSCSLLEGQKVIYEYPPYKKLWKDLKPPTIDPFIKPVEKLKPVKKAKRISPKKVAQVAKAEPNDMTLEEAYAFAGTARRNFADYPNTIAKDEDSYLKQLFKLTDIMVIERNRSLKTGIFKAETHGVTLAKIEVLNPPAELREFHNKIVKAFRDQLAYYKKSKNEHTLNPSDPLVQSSHNELYGAYMLLMQKYSSQSESVKYTFYSHLQPACFI